MFKKSFICVLFISNIIFFLTGAAVAEITNSAHDFQNRSWNYLGQICKVCHTPHDAITPSSVPLWNHSSTSATYTVYCSPTFNAGTGPSREAPTPSASSKACLSCHDGTVALDAFGGNGGTGTRFSTGTENLGTNLSNDHPISFIYDAALAAADGNLSDPTIKTVNALNGKTIDEGLLVDHKIECSSCHDVHRARGDSKLETTGTLLLVNNTGSALCLTCHNK